MKIDPKHDYKKPLYAVGTAALIGATAIFGTACGGPELGGDKIVTQSTEYSKRNADQEPDLMGEVAAPTETGLDFAGDVAEDT